jgi:3-hydroxybutyryl-CoA dehydratase
MKGLSIQEIQIGDSASFSKTVTETDVILFAGITGDLNPAHVNADYAGKSMFKQRIAHGILSAGFISNVLAMKLPGRAPSIFHRN